MEPMQRKTFTAPIKAGEEAGSFEAVIATLNVRDLDGDVILPGSLAGQTATILPAHDSSAVSMGKVKIEDRGNQVIAVGQFNLKVSAARDWYEAIKFDVDNPPVLQEWSWAYEFEETPRIETFTDGEPARFFEAGNVKVPEVSPVLRGASIGSTTLSAKAADRHKTETSADPWDVGAVLREKAVETHELSGGVGIVHHFTNGEASTRACVAGIVDLNLRSFGNVDNGAARKAAYDHLAGHLEDAGIEAPELLSQPGCKLADQVRLVTWQAESATVRLEEVASKTMGGLSGAVKAEAIQMAAAVEEMIQVSLKLAQLVAEITSQDEVALALAEYVASEARRRLGA